MRIITDKIGIDYKNGRISTSSSVKASFSFLNQNNHAVEMFLNNSKFIFASFRPGWCDIVRVNVFEYSVHGSTLILDAPFNLKKRNNEKE